jgi:hypothetical protein
MKKFAVLAAAGFMAFSAISCTDEEGTEGGGVVLSDKWDKSGTVELGGASNADLGSFLDIDVGNPFTVYKKGQSAANNSKIDLIFDGNNLLTPEGCSSGTFCDLDENDAALVDVSSVSAIKAASVPSDIQDWVDSHLDADGVPDDMLMNLIVSKVSAKKGGTYLVLTTGDNLALVVVGDDLSTASVTLSIGRTPLP